MTDILHAKPKTKRKANVHLTVFAVVFMIYSVVLLFPFLWLIFNSVKDKTEFFLNPLAMPQHPFVNIKNFAVMVTEFQLGEMFFNTVFLSVLSPLIGLFFTTCVAYAYAKHRFKLRSALFAVAMLPMVVNIAGTQSATYKLINDIGIFDNLVGILVLSMGGFGVNFLLLSSVFINVSDAYREAAKIDGAGNWRIFLTIYVPQAGGMLIILYILSFIGTWNDFMTPYLYLPSHPTLATGIQRLSAQISGGNAQYVNDYPKLFAAMLVTILPVMILFIAFQKRIMRFSLGGGIKG